MNKPIDFDLIQRRQALDDWLYDCERRMGLRFPKIVFEADNWPIRTLHQTPQKDWYFSRPLADFAAKDVSYRETVRCLVAEMVIAGQPKFLPDPIDAFRELASAPAHRLFDLTLQNLRAIESEALVKAKSKPVVADKMLTRLNALAKLTAQLATKGVLPRLGFHVRADVTAELRNIASTHKTSRRAGKLDLLDRKMEAFNETLNALADNDPRLNALDRVAIAATTRALCAPSRINEILCSSIDDHVTVEDYAQRSIGEKDATHRAHQMLLVTMKGSKGAQWSAKPVLDFMIDAFHYTTGVIRKHGERSRMLVEWYKKNPTTLYLPPELEYLRGRELSRRMLAKIVHLTENPPPGAQKSSAREYFDELKDRQFKASNPVTYAIGQLRTWRIVDVVPWTAVEELLLRKVHRALDDCRKVTVSNYYEGDLSIMLFLFDQDETPYLPYAVNYPVIRRRLKQTDLEKQRHTLPPTVFEKLGITMPANGKIHIAEMDTHDPRRWLTTMALIHGEKLSDVLINKWARRCRLSQLKAYDLRTAEDLAEFSKMPETPKLAELAELTELSNGLAAAEKMEAEFGLKTAIVTAHDAGISMTSMELVAQATENRPVANSSRGIIIIYPQRFGVCFHQHHEKPCRNYSNSLVASCVTCDEAAYVKGHIPTNDETRRVARQVFSSIVRHLENLAHTHNRGIADDQDALGDHMLTLVEKGVSPAALEQVAVHLIEEFHQIKHLIKDKLLARQLEEAFVAREVVKILDDLNRPSGALIRYHNPTQHGDPLLEVALDSHGGREQVACDEKELIARYPQFAPKALGLKDERHLVEPDDEEKED